jgi:hypothetical protein
MKRGLTIAVFCASLFFGVLLFSLLPIKANIFSAAYAQEVNWYRAEYLCPDEVHYKVRCTMGGSEQCEAKYCIPPAD